MFYLIRGPDSEIIFFYERIILGFLCCRKNVIIKKKWSDIMIDFPIIRDWVNFAANMCILVITIYTFFITFISQKIKLRSISTASSNSEGNSFSVVLENKTLSPILIDNINLIVDGQYKVKVKRFDSPLILEPFTAKKVTSEKYSYTVPNLENMSDYKNVVEVNISGKKIYLSLNKNTPKVSKNMKQSRENVIRITNTYNGKNVPQFAKYILIVSKDDWNNTVFIFESGAMTGEIFGYNSLPKKVVKKKAKLIEYLDDWFKPNVIDYYVEEISNLFEDSPDDLDDTTN